MAFSCADPDSSFVFEPAGNNRFHWYGKELDKIGKYEFVEAERSHIELVWNYGREQSYTVVSFEGTGDAMTKFVLKNDKTQECYSFFR